MVGAVGALIAAALPAIAAVSWTGPAVRVVITGKPSTQAQTRTLIEREGGKWVRNLDMLDGGIADVPSDGIGPLRSAGWIQSVVVEGGPQATFNGAPAVAVAPDRIADIDDVIFATNSRNASWSGQHGYGVDIAMIDSGVSPVAGLKSGRLHHIDVTTGKLVPGNDQVYDKIGHGTHGAGILIGDPWGPLGSGIAYASNLVSVNVTNANGGASLSEVLAGIDAVVKNKNSGGLNIRVLLMAIGFESNTPAGRLVMRAAENAVNNGIVVVAAAGNGGQFLWKLDSPAASPGVIAVAAENLNNVTDVNDDWAAGFSQYSSSRPPDVMAPGVSIRSARVPGSLIDEAFPGGRVDESSFLGSGTSQAAAVTAGLVAKLLSERPTLTPNEVKAVLKASARKLPGVPDYLGGAGAIDYETARWTPVPWGGAPGWTPSSMITWGSYDPVKYDDTQGGQLDGTRWTGTRWTGTRWTGTRWTTLGETTP
jgi:serine protease AprX